MTDLRVSARTANGVLFFVLMVVAGLSVFHAIIKPFWFDEICTLIVAQLRSMTDVWDALKAAADGNPPVYYAIVRLAHAVIPDEHLALRLPSILGVMIVIACLYISLSSRIDRLSALVGATFVLCTRIGSYAYEGRPYALMLACVSVAILAWLRMERSRGYAVLLGIALALSVSMHYWAVLVWPAFVIAEATVVVFYRRLRVGVWLALAAGATPLLVWRPLMVSLKEYYGESFWARPSLMQLFESHDWLFRVGGYWGWFVAAALTAAFGFWVLRRFRNGAAQEPPASPFHIEDGVLVTCLLWVPVVAVVVARLSHSGMDERYMQPAILAAAMAAGYLSSRVSVALRSVLLLLTLTTYALISVRDVQAVVMSGSIYSRRAAATHAMDRALAQTPDLPMVISSGLQYLPMAYYHSPDQRQRMFALTDPPAAVKFASSDSVDRILLVLRNYYPLQVKEYQAFAATHREFLLFSGSLFDWWPARLLADGQTLILLSENAGNRLYKVVLKP